ncbi:CocE/NonD family hydrolase, partial [Frankia sp. CcI49]
HAAALETSMVPTLVIAGWQDIFLSQSMEQYRRLHARGVDVALTVGAWVHADILLRGGGTIVRESLHWLEEYLGGSGARGACVRVQVGPLRRWIELPEWPPHGEKRTWHLHPGARLERHPPGSDATASEFVYDPADPTPTIGGNLIRKGGYRNDSAYVGRPDVLVYDTSPFNTELVVLGAPVVTLAHRSDRPDADLFVRLSDVDPSGRSRGVCEGYWRAQRGEFPIDLCLNDTAHIFARGHRLRLIVAGGSFPQYARNPGTENNPLTATELYSNRHVIKHADGASTLRLPVGSFPE